MNTEPVLSEVIEDYIVEKHVDEALRELIGGLTRNGRLCVEALIHYVNPSANTLRGFLELAREVGLRDKREVEEILGGEGIKEILTEEKLSQKEKQKKVRAYLEELRFPEIAEVKRKLSHEQREILKKFGFVVELPEDLEGEQLQVSLTFKSEEDLAKKSEGLLAVSQSGELKNIFSILKGQA